MRQLFVVGLLLSPAIVLTSPTQQSATQRLAETRAALGGARASSGLQSVRLQVHDRDRMGTMRGNARPPTFVDGYLTFSVRLPDHFVSEGRRSAGPSEARWGFAGSTNIGEGGGARQYEHFGYLMFALFLKTDTRFPFHFAGLENGALHFVDMNKVDVYVDLNVSTKRPERIRFDDVERGLDGAPNGIRYPTRLELADYRQTGGLWIPRSVRRVRYEDIVVQERRIESVEINPTLGATTFAR